MDRDDSLPILTLGSDGTGVRNPLAVISGALSAGNVFVNTFNGAGTTPRTGQIVGR